MKKLIFLITTALCLVSMSAASAAYTEPQLLTENDFSSFSEGTVDIKEIAQLDGEIGEGGDDLIHIKDLGKDDVHGNSLVFQKGNQESGYITAPGKTMLKIKTGSKNEDGTYNSCDTEMIIEYDFYWSGNFKSPERFIMYLCGEANGESVRDTGINITDGYMEFNKYTSGQSAVRYSKQTWYRAVHTVNLLTDTYTYTLYNMDGSVKASASGPLNTSLDSLSEVRFTMNMSQLEDVGTDKYIAFDNIKLTYNDILPDINAVKYCNADGEYQDIGAECPSGVRKIRVMLDGPIKATGKMEDCIDIDVSGLESEDITCSITDFQYVKSGLYIDIEFETGLKAGTVYLVSLNDTARTSFGNELYESVSHEIIMEKDFVESCTFTETEDGQTKAVLSFVPETEEIQTVVLAVIYSGDMMKAVQAKNVTVNETNYLHEISMQVESGETMEVYVWDSLEDCRSMVSRLYILNK